MAAKSSTDVKRKLVDAGTTLMNPYEGVNDLLKRLEDICELLKLVHQMGKAELLKEFQPLINKLVTNKLLTHKDVNIKVSAASCLCEILRITAPDQPYCDDKMKDVLDLIVHIFKWVPCLVGHSYKKAVEIIGVVAACQLYTQMYSLHKTFIVQMCVYIFRAINSKERVHPASLISNMEHIMIGVINKDYKDVPVHLLYGCLTNKYVTDCTYRMSKRVFERCAHKLKPHFSIDEYEDIIARIKLDVGEAGDDGQTQLKRKSILLNEEDVLKGKKLMTDSTKASFASSEKVEVHGYFIKASNASILEAIIAKYGDIAVNCQFKTPSVRASLLEVVCSVIERLRKYDNNMDINDMISELTDVVNAKIEVAWLLNYLNDILKEKEDAVLEMRNKMSIALSAAQLKLRDIEPLKHLKL